VVSKPRALVGTIVWGENYIRNWLKFSLPTWLAPGNLPELTRHVDAEFRIYTREEDIPILDADPIGHKLSSLMPIRIYKIGTGDAPAVNMTHEAFHGDGGIIYDAIQEDCAVIYLTPDILWVNGSLGYIAKSLASGNVLVMAPEYRVVQETIIPELRSVDDVNVIRPQDGRRLLLRHFSPLHSCYHPKGKRVPDHCEILCWPVKNEGLLIYNMSRDTGFFWPARVRYTSQKLPDASNDFSKFDMVQNTDCALGLGLTPLAQNLNWLRGGKPFDSVRVAQFLLCFYTAYNDIRIRRPVVVSLMEKLTPRIWEAAENEAVDCFNLVAQSVNAMATNDLNFAYPPAPASLPDGANPTDIDLCVEALEWLGPVIAQRFQQRGLAYLSEMRAKYPGGDLPGYCSSWPTVLPPRP
jgi:hypothetical protein